MSAEYGPQPPRPLARKDIMPWIETSVSARLNADVLERLMPAAEGSFMKPTPDDPLKNMTSWCHGFLEGAADHLLFWAEYATPLKFHPDAETVYTLRPAFTLARATIESAAHAIWVLSPEEATETGRRYIQLGIWDVMEQLKAASTKEARTELRARRDEILERLGLTTRTFRPPTYLTMIRDAAEFLGAGDPSDPLTPDRVERVWRSAAASAHGKRWPDFELHDREDVGGGLYSTVPKTGAISEALQIAERFLSAGVILFAMRAGRMDDFRRLWDEATVRLAGQITTVDGEPVDLEQLANELRLRGQAPDGSESLRP